MNLATWWTAGLAEIEARGPQNPPCPDVAARVIAMGEQIKAQRALDQLRPIRVIDEDPSLVLFERLSPTQVMLG